MRSSVNQSVLPPDVLLAPKAILRGGIFFLRDHDSTIKRSIIQWNIGSHRGRYRHYANISFTADTRLLESSCDITINKTSLIVQFVYWPQHGHALFNVISNIYQTLKEINLQFGRIRLYAAIDHENAAKKLNDQIRVGHYAPLFKALSVEPVYNYFVLLNASLSRTICFTNSIAFGVSKQLDQYNPAVASQDWQLFAKWILRVFQLPRTTKNCDSSSVEQQVVITMISRRTRKIINLDELKKVTERKYGSSVLVQIIDLADIPFVEQLKYMRNTTILLGIDGTGLMNSLFMLNRCGVVIHIGTYKMRTLLPSKGLNIQRLAEAGTASGRVIYSEIENLMDVSQAQRDALRYFSVKNMTFAKKMYLAQFQDIRLQPSQYVELQEQASDMVRTCRKCLSESE